MCFVFPALLGERVPLSFPFSISNFILNFSMQRALKLMWGMLNVTMFVIFMRKWQINLPIYSNVIIDKLKVLVLGEFIPSGLIKRYIYEFLGLELDCDGRAQC